MHLFWTIVILAFYVAGLVFLFALSKTKKRRFKFATRVFIALGIGLLLGFASQFVFGTDYFSVGQAVPWIKMFGNIYIAFLKVITIPLVIVSIIGAVLRSTNLGKIATIVIVILVITATVAAMVGLLTSAAFNLSAEGLTMGSEEESRGDYFVSTADTQTKMTVPERIESLFSSNIFFDMSGSRSSSTIAVVIFCMFIGIAANGIRKKHPEHFEKFKTIIEVIQSVVMRMVTLVIRMTPYAIFSIIMATVMTTNGKAISQLLIFIIASYVAIILMFIIHLCILMFAGYSPVTYVKKMIPVLVFAFTSRTSMGTLPLTIDTSTKKLGLEPGVASLAGTFGTSIGQNGCAAIYPAMLAVMIAPTVGLNAMSPSFFIPLLFIIALTSFGIAGVGGGATYAAILVLSSMGLPIELAGLLVSIEPLIDMARTALNVSDSVVSGLVTAKITKNVNMTIYNDKTVESDATEL